MRSQNPWLVRLVFAGVIVTFAGQLLVARADAEPYPGLFQPRFAGSPLKDGVLNQVQPSVSIEFTDGSSSTVPYKDILPRSRLHAIDVFRSAFCDELPATDPRTVAWLRQRLEVRFPDQTAALMVVEWARTSYLESASWQSSRSVIKTVTVPLQQ